ncbi:MAG: hypothetical protein KAX78_02860, partial [Phycisphaerae bacterium]|nr:hypothetical protein [Phycisphaerae bacterium]
MPGGQYECARRSARPRATGRRAAGRAEALAGALGLKVVCRGETDFAGSFAAGLRKGKSMNARERMLAVINHQSCDRIPTDIWAVPEVWAGLRDHFGADADLGEMLHVDGFAGVGPRYIGPALPDAGDDETVDIWGVRRRKVDYGAGEYYEQWHNPLAAARTIDDLEQYPWPDPDWFDYSQMRSAADARREKQAVMCGYMAPFTYHQYLRGLETSLTDPLVDAE